MRSVLGIAAAGWLLAALTAQSPRPDAEAMRALRAARLLELPQRRSEAWLELLRLQRASAPPLAQLLADPRPEVALRAAFVLGQLGEAGAAAVPALRARAAGDDTELAAACRWALHRVEARLTVLVDYQGDVRVLGADGQPQRTLKVNGAWHAEALADGHLLVAEYSGNRVVEYDAAGKAVWTCKQAKSPLRCQRLPDGNTLIADSGSARVIEVDGQDRIVSSIGPLSRPTDAERLGDGHTLVADAGNGQVTEYDAAGKAVWKCETGDKPMDADRLANGNTLISLFEAGKVIEVTPGGEIAASLAIAKPQSAMRLADGRTLVATSGAFVEFDAAGKEVARRPARYGSLFERY